MRRQPAPEGKDQLLSVCDFSEPDAVITTIVTTVAQLRGEGPESLDPLDDAVDSEALTDLFTPLFSDERRGPGRIDFTYAGCAVTLTSDGHVIVART